MLNQELQEDTPRIYSEEEQQIVEQLTRELFGTYKSFKQNGKKEEDVCLGGFYNSILGQMLTIIDAVLDKDKADSTKSIVRQMLQARVDKEIYRIYKRYNNDKIISTPHCTTDLVENDITYSSTDVKIDLGEKQKDGSYYNKETGATITNTK